MSCVNESRNKIRGQRRPFESLRVSGFMCDADGGSE